MKEIRFMVFIWFFSHIMAKQDKIDAQLIFHSTNHSYSFIEIPIEEHILSDVPNSGRPSYRSINSEPPLYLYHSFDIDSGEGQWIVSNLMKYNSPILCSISSWSPLPFNNYQLNENPVHNKSTQNCSVISTDSSDEVIYFESSAQAPLLSGIYIKRKSSVFNHIVYSKIKFLFEEENLYLFPYQLPDESVNWLIGSIIGQDSAVAYSHENSIDIRSMNQQWNFINNDASVPWKHDPLGKFYFPSNYGTTNIYEMLTLLRANNKLDSDLSSTFLSNNVKMPSIGLGTGGIYLEETKEVLYQAFEVGYRLFDLAREYQNEYIMGEVLLDLLTRKSISRQEVFLETKVWPTDLGFRETLEAIKLSLGDLSVSYIDLMLLHWPSCNPSIEWMHCETTKNFKATWKESWRAFEKAYMEGRLRSLGVSNFDVSLLEEVEDLALVLPHVIQNWADLTYFDLDVRSWAQPRGIVYQPYATVRNLRFLPQDKLNLLKHLSQKYHTSEQKIVLKFFLQTNTSIIPRSRSLSHLRDNLQMFNWELTLDELRALGWDTPPESSFNLTNEGDIVDSLLTN